MPGVLFPLGSKKCIYEPVGVIPGPQFSNTPFLLRQTTDLELGFQAVKFFRKNLIYFTRNSASKKVKKEHFPASFWVSKIPNNWGDPGNSSNNKLRSREQPKYFPLMYLQFCTLALVFFRFCSSRSDSHDSRLTTRAIYYSDCIIIRLFVY